jgi:HEAT repeat protein
VNTPSDLALCLDGLRRRRNLSYEAMDKAAQNLRSRTDGKRWESLGKSTVGEIVKGKRLPTKRKLMIFLAVCQVASADVTQWLAAWERASTAHLLQSADTPDGRDLTVNAEVPHERRVMSEYLRRIQDYYQQLNLEMLLAMTNIEDRLRVPLLQVFTPPLARENPPAVELPREFRRRLLHSEEADPRGMPRDLESEFLGSERNAYRHQPARPVLGLVAAPDHRHMVLLGDPGSGKSTFARYLVLRLAQLHSGVVTGGINISPDPLPALAGALPLLVELRLYTATSCTSFVEFIDQLHLSQGLGLPKLMLDSYLDSGRPVLIVFDGLDEVFDRDRRNAVCREIREFSRRHPNARTVVTSRPVGYNRQTLDDAGFKLYQLQDLEDSQIVSFVAAWYTIACVDDYAEAEWLTGRMTSALQSSSAVNELAGNPLLLTLLCIMGRRRELPRDRVHVYEFAVSLLVEHWDVEAHSFPNHESLLYEDKLDLLRILARTMLLGKGGIGGNRITEHDLQRAFETYLEEERGYTRPVARTAAHSMIDQLRIRNYILSRFGAGMYGFVHRAFLEYLAALDIVNMFDNRLMDEQALLAMFDEHGADPAWSEVLLLVIRMKERFAAQIIERLLAADQAWRFDEAHPPSRSLLCVRGLREVRPTVRLTSQVKAVMARVFELLLTLESNPNGALQEALREAALPTFVVLGQRWVGASLFRIWYANVGKYLSGPVARLAAQMSAPLGSVADLTVDARADYDPMVRGIATEGLASQRDWDAAVPTLLVHRANTDPVGDVRRTALSALFAKWTTEPTVRALVERHADIDPDPVVRRTCIELLNATRVTDPQIRALMLRRAESDADPRVRAAAVNTLALQFRADPVAVTQVRKCLQADADAVVRQAAVDGIVGATPDSVESYELIADRAVNDTHRSVRQIAVRALAAITTNRAEAQVLLTVSATTDPDAGVRQAVLEVIVTLWPGAGATRNTLVDRALNDAHWTVRRTALKSLAGVWSHHPETLPLLVERAMTDDDEDARIAALFGASSPLLDYSDAYELLLTAYASDASPSVRRGIVEMFADTERDEATTRAHLLQWAVEDPDWSVRSRAFEALAAQWPQDLAVRKLFFTQAVRDPDEDVRRIILSGISRSELPDTYSFIVGRATSDDSDVVRMAALGCLAAAWREIPDTQLILCAHASQDQDESIRRAALSAIAATWPADSDIRSLVTTAVQHDPDWGVRQTSILSTMRAWPEHPETVPLVLARAVSDQSPSVRQTAVQALAVERPTDPRVRATLLALANSDQSATVRRAALRGLTQGRGDKEETLQLVMRLANSDPHSVVRLAATQALAYFWPNDSAARATVSRLALDDPDLTVRGVATEVVELIWT